MSSMHPKAVLYCLLWYFWSGCTLFLNKYVVFIMKGNSTFLACSQMWATLLLGWFQMHFPLGMFAKKPREKELPKSFTKSMVIIGCLRFLTVIFGLIALNYVEVSFTETVKSSAPFFTAVISRVMTGETTGTFTKLSLIPIMGGLALCSANELSFHFLGFLAAIGTNLSECIQNVFSKLLISGDKIKCNPAEIQYYTSLYSLLVQIPAMIFLIDFSSIEWTREYVSCCILNGVFFHFQTMSAYVLMDFISPVTHSVANTAKRALLIMLSVILFGNEVTFLAGLGTFIVMFGVIIYTKAKEIDRKNQLQDSGAKKLYGNHKVLQYKLEEARIS